MIDCYKIFDNGKTMSFKCDDSSIVIEGARALFLSIKEKTQTTKKKQKQRKEKQPKENKSN